MNSPDTSTIDCFFQEPNVSLICYYSCDSIFQKQVFTLISSPEIVQLKLDFQQNRSYNQNEMDNAFL